MHFPLNSIVRAKVPYVTAGFIMYLTIHGSSLFSKYSYLNNLRLKL